MSKAYIPATNGPGPLLFDDDLERLYRLRKQTWRLMRVQGRGPRFIMLGARCAYRPRDVELWFEENTVSSTAEAKAKTAARADRRGAA